MWLFLKRHKVKKKKERKSIRWTLKCFYGAVCQDIFLSEKIKKQIVAQKSVNRVTLYTYILKVTGRYVIHYFMCRLPFHSNTWPPRVQRLCLFLALSPESRNKQSSLKPVVPYIREKGLGDWGPVGRERLAFHSFPIPHRAFWPLATSACSLCPEHTGRIERGTREHLYTWSPLPWAALSALHWIQTYPALITDVPWVEIHVFLPLDFFSPYLQHLSGPLDLNYKPLPEVCNLLPGPRPTLTYLHIRSPAWCSPSTQ